MVIAHRDLNRGRDENGENYKICYLMRSPGNIP